MIARFSQPLNQEIIHWTVCNAILELPFAASE